MSTITITTSWPGYFRQPDKMRIKHDLQARLGCYRIWPEYYLSKEVVSVLSFYFQHTGSLQNSHTEGTKKLLKGQNSSHIPESVTSFAWYTMQNQSVWRLSAMCIHVKIMCIFSLSASAKECQGHLPILIQFY